MITKEAGVQAPCYAEADFTFADLVSGAFAEAIKLPSGAKIIDGALEVSTPFDSVTSDTGTIGDADTEDRYKAGINMASAGVTRLVPVAGVTANTADKRSFGIRWTGVGTAPTAGAGKVWVLYTVDGRADFVQR